MPRFVAGLIVLTLSLFGAAEADATVMFSASSGNLSADATFTVSGSQLEIVLTNTATTAETSRADALTGVFFSLPSGVTLTPVSATGEEIVQENDPSTQGGSNVNVGGEFIYDDGGRFGFSAPAGTNHGIASTREYVNGRGNFNGPNLHGTNNVGAISFAIVSDAFEHGLANKPLIQNSATFLLDINGTLSESDISNVMLAYGNRSNSPVLQAWGASDAIVPEPTALALIGVGLVGLAVRRRRRPHV